MPERYQWLRSKIESFLEEDLGFGDITTDALIGEEQAEAHIIAKADGIVAGLSEAAQAFSILGCKSQSLVEEGSRVAKGTKLLRIDGPAASILKGERVALNILSRMSGIATMTAKFVALAKAANPDVKVASTRKTVPGLRFLDKRAVDLGGGDTHRIRLDDSVLIKDNHLAVVGSVRKAVEKARKAASFTKKVEVEVSNLKGALEAAQAGADILMLDNVPPDSVRKIGHNLKRKGLRERILLEASGNITLENTKAYAAAGVDIVSVGALTHSAKALDMSLEIVKVKKGALQVI